MGDIDMAGEHQAAWQDALDTFKPLHLSDTGGDMTNTPFVYCVNRGHFCYTETDNYPDPLDPEQLSTSIAYMVYGAARFVKDRINPYPIIGVPAEPFTSFFPEVGPNINLLLRKIRRVFDPNDVAVPGRQVFTEEEFRQFPDDKAEQINSIRVMNRLEPIKKINT